MNSKKMINQLEAILIAALFYVAVYFELIFFSNFP